MTVEVGNIYNTPVGKMFQVNEVSEYIARITNIRTGESSMVSLEAMRKYFVLIGKPYKEIDRTK